MSVTVKKILHLLVIIIFSYTPLAGAKAYHAITLYDEAPKYPANFKHFDYVNPEAPKGGELKLPSYGGFDSLNGFIARGKVANYVTALLYDTLAVRSQDEPNTIYGLVAEKIEKPDDASWVRFYLRKNAKFNDGHPITAADIVFSFNILREKGAPHYRQYYADVDKIIAETKHTVLFKFKVKNNRELPLIMGELPVLPEHWWQDKEFSETSLSPPLGSGPYQVAKIKAGSSVRLERVKDWWAQGLPAARGSYNFDVITIDYYRDMSVALEAFKAGQFDFNMEYTAKNWATGYTGTALRDNKIIKKEIENHNPAPIQGFVFNLRRPIFQDKKVRKAISLLFDFEWSNRQLFYNSYKRLGSYFENSEMAAHELPDENELAILEPLRDKIPEEVFTQIFKPSTTDGSGLMRAKQREAYELLKEAGYHIKNNKMVNAEGKPLAFEFMLAQTNLERVLLPFKENLAVIGIDMQIRRVDAAQFVNRLRSRDYDMVSFIWGQSNSPGNEQLNYWHSGSAGQSGSMNVIGLKDPAIDTLVEALTQANTRQSLIAHAKALDRVLQWGYYVVWNYYTDKWRIAYWDKFGQPNKAPDYDLGLFTWWSLEAEQQANAAKQAVDNAQKTVGAPEKPAKNGHP